MHIFFWTYTTVWCKTSAIFDKLMCFMTDCGITENILAEQLVGFCSDGASCMIGQFGVVASLLKANCPLEKTFHSMVHRLELAVKNAVDIINACFTLSLFY
jgi:hypothetical protein